MRENFQLKSLNDTPDHPTCIKVHNIGRLIFVEERIIVQIRQ